MKKKILNIVSAILLIVMLFALTGCGNNNQDNSNLSKDSVSDDQKQSEVTELEFIQIEQPYKDGYALLRSNEKNSSDNTIYYFVDSEGKVVYKEGIYNLSHQKIMNGYYIRNYGNNSVSSSIIDLSTGKTVLDGVEPIGTTTSVSYKDISENKYVVVLRKEETLAGDVCKTNIEDMHGNVIYGMDEEANYKWLCKDIFYLQGKDKSILIDAKANDVMELDRSYSLDSVKGFKNYISMGDTIITVDLSTKYEKVPTMISELNNKCYLSYNGITDFSGNVLYDFKEGGFSKVYYHDGTYYVLSNNDFRYTLDEEFNFVAQPDKFYRSSLFTLKSNGVLSTGNGIGIRDKDLNKVQGIEVDIDTEKVDIQMTEQYVDEFVYISDYENNRSVGTKKVYNLKTDEFITFHK